MSEMMKTARSVLFRKKAGHYYQLTTDLQPDWTNVYPRPQMKRAAWLSLNGIWQIGSGESDFNKKPESQKTICVPFPPQALCSGFESACIEDIPEELLYEREFSVPLTWTRSLQKGYRVLLHVGAADQRADVFINGRPAGSHEGGYLPFTLDITDFLRPLKEDNRIRIFVQDHLDHYYPWGKQKKERGGMWYTPCSGIWQTVWLELVPSLYLTDLSFTPDGSYGVNCTVHLSDSTARDLPIQCEINLDGTHIFQMKGCVDSFRIDLLQIAEETGIAPRHWTPEDPWLYRMKLTCGEDCVETYFALRTVDIRDCGGRARICLNGKPIFLKGVLDQGYWPDGLFLPPSPEGYTKDILAMKAVGLNLIRKHIKIEPSIFYYECDRLGMLVMQDMVNSGGYSFVRDTALPTIGIQKFPQKGLHAVFPAEEERRQFFLRHACDTQDHLHNHPCIIAYTVFNEGWGQFAPSAVGGMLADRDPSRIYDYTSGWFDDGSNPIRSIHDYFSLKPLQAGRDRRPMLLSECGGYTWKLSDHSYAPEAQYGYGSCASSGELADRIQNLLEQKIKPSIPEGLCGFIYTQLSDIEDEVNGLYSYDRKVCKLQEASEDGRYLLFNDPELMIPEDKEK